MSTIIMNNNNTSNKMRVKLDEDRFEEVQISYIKSEGRQQEGKETNAIGSNSHTEGEGTIAAGKNQHVQGQYNIEDIKGAYAHIVGNGKDDLNRSNAHTLDWEGNAWFAGNVKVGTGNGRKLATEEYVSSAIEAIEPYKLPQATSSALGGVKTGYTSNGKNYAVNLNNDGQMYVAVPWTDTDTNDNTTYILSKEENGSSIKLTSSSGSVNTIALGSAAYTNSGNYVANQSGHNFQIAWNDSTPILNIDWNAEKDNYNASLALATQTWVGTQNFATQSWVGNQKFLYASQTANELDPHHPHGNVYNIHLADIGVQDSRLPKDRTESIFTGFSFKGNKNFSAQLLIGTANPDSNGDGCRQGGVYVRSTTNPKCDNWSNWIEISTRIYENPKGNPGEKGNVNAYAELREGAFRPSKVNGALNVFDIGDSDHKWRNGYFSGTVNQGSDLRLKTNISKLIEDSRYIKLFDAIEPYKYHMIQDEEQIYHTGFIAQEVENALKNVGLNESDCRFLVKPKSDDSYYSLAYTEYIAIMAAKIKSLEKRIQELEKK